MQHRKRKLIIAIPATAEPLSLSAPTVTKTLQRMVKLGMVRETTCKQRHRLFTYQRYLVKGQDSSCKARLEIYFQPGFQKGGPTTRQRKGVVACGERFFHD